MKVNFRGKKLDIKNEKDSKKEFLANWNRFTIEILPYETHYSSDGKRKLKYEGYCINGLGSCLCDATTHNTISEALQECFDNISIDIDDLKSQYDEISEYIELLKDYIN